MILIKYIMKEICKNQLIILILLLLACFCQKSIKVLSLSNSIPIYWIFLYLFLSIPDLGKLIIPFSLFLSVLISCYRLHMHNEILAMYSCAVNKYVLIQSICMYSTVIAILSLINLAYLAPHCEQYKENIFFKMKKNTYFIELIEKKFYLLFDEHLVLFIDNIKNGMLNHVFILKRVQNIDKNVFSIITADQGSIHYNFNDKSQLIILKSGMYYEIHNTQLVCIPRFVTYFNQYRTLVHDKYQFLRDVNKSVKHMNINQLLISSELESYIELNWRLTVFISVFIMPMIALFVMMNIAYGYLSNFLLAVVLYVFFYMLHIILYTCSVLNYMNIIILMWIINCIYLIILLLMNVWESFRFKCLRIIFIYLLKK